RLAVFFFSSRRRHTRSKRDWSSDVCSSDLVRQLLPVDAIITYGAGNFSGWATRFLPAHGFPSALGPRNGSMGFGLPAAVAAGLEIGRASCRERVQRWELAGTVKRSTAAGEG